ncbi:acyltransferase family protein [Alsobacter soli]|uniref:acyltransferase family protein n=1 Tax=Alsobacter soli TaxID=2109933 RepID=UPI00130505D9|nr:acyltransferase [Alsobacter soli]
MNRHFLILDGLRGIAAVSVLVYHGGVGMKGGFLAVDLFFVLSGFVLAYSYSGRLAAGMTFWSFSLQRFIRLYPLTVVGTLAGLLTLLAHNLSHVEDSYSLGELSRLTGLSLLVAPSLSGSSFAHEVFPLNTVLWSLFFEWTVNIAFGVIHGALTTKRTFALCMFGLAGVLLSGELGGNMPQNFWSGFPRVTFGFFGGVLLHDLWRGQTAAWMRLGFWPAAGAILLLLSVDWPIWAFPLAGILIAALILSSARGQVTGIEAILCAQLGALSYPIYVLHRPVQYFVDAAMKRIGLADWSRLDVATAALVTSLVGFGVLRAYDEPVRAWLSAATRATADRRRMFASRQLDQ